MLFDDPKKQARYDAAIAACADFDPPLTDEEKDHIAGAITFGGGIFLRNKFDNKGPSFEIKVR